MQANRSNELSVIEAAEVRKFLIFIPAEQQNVEPTVEEKELEIVDAARAAKKKRINDNVYRSVRHIRPTSDSVERLFSRAKLIMTDNRKHMTSDHMNMLLFLRYQQNLWSVNTVQQMLNEMVN